MDRDELYYVDPEYQTIIHPKKMNADFDLTGAGKNLKISQGSPDKTQSPSPRGNKGKKGSPKKNAGVPVSFYPKDDPNAQRESRTFLKYEA